jgi:membrane-bound lytic murein transglycosylase B
MQGAAKIRGRWPDDERPLPREARAELQRLLAALGYNVNNFEGQVDFDLRDNVREIQASAGLIADGNPDAAVLALVRARAGDKR